MLLSFALVLCAVAFVAFFAEEFGQFLKKILSIPGLSLILPLILASTVIMTYDNYAPKHVMWAQASLHFLFHQLAMLTPFEKMGFEVFKILFVVFLALIPRFFFYYKVQRKNHLRIPSVRIYWLSVYCWVLGVWILVLPLQ